MCVEDVPEPMLKDDDVLVNVSAVGICGSELEAFRRPDGLRVPPLVMGHEIAGIDANGDRVVVNPLLSCGVCKACAAGHRQRCSKRELIGVHRPGGFAERVAVPASACHGVDAALSPAATSFIEPLANAVHALRLMTRFAPRPSTLAIFGAGALGLAVALVANAEGIADITVIDRQRARLDAARVLPVEVATELQGEYDAVVDAVGASETRESSVRRLRPGHPAVWIGLADAEAHIDGNALVRGERCIVGSYAYEDTDFAVACSLAASVPTTWIEEIPLDLAAIRFVELARSPGSYPRTVIRPSGAEWS